MIMIIIMIMLLGQVARCDSDIAQAIANILQHITNL